MSEPWKIVAGLLGALAALGGYVWQGLTRRVRDLETWRRDHEGAHTQILLSLQSLEIHGSATRESLGRVEALLVDMAACVAANRRAGAPCPMQG